MKDQLVFWGWCVLFFALFAVFPPAIFLGLIGLAGYGVYRLLKKS